MARVKISEYRAKTLLNETLGGEYRGIELDVTADYQQQVADLFKKYKLGVIKVDQAVKKRNKLGLVKVKVTQADVLKELKTYKNKGYRWALLEPLLDHTADEERFLSLELVEDGVAVFYSSQGGVSIEDNADTVKKYLVKDGVIPDELVGEGLDKNTLQALVTLFNDNHFVNLEINPLVIQDNRWSFLDAALQVDSAADFFVDSWSVDRDGRKPAAAQYEAEKEVEVLASRSPASLALKVLNPQGSVFLLLSGGGASVVVLDELAAHKQIYKVANYGEYSGNPNRQDTYHYTKSVLKLMRESKASPKALMIVGGVANFTDTTKTFDGIIDAFEEESDLLVQPDVTVVVRRGGPNDVAGLAHMQSFLEKKGILHAVHTADTSIAAAVAEACQFIEEKTK